MIGGLPQQGSNVPMRQSFAALAAIAALVSACAADEAAPRPPSAPPPIVRAPPAAPTERAPAPIESRDGIVVPDVPSGVASHLSTVSPLPPRAPLYALPAPALSAPVGAAPNLGPVTGYGPGGMGTIPGSPANPPYH
jgi:hypothetical protein